MKRIISVLIIISMLPAMAGCGGIHINYREIQQLLVVQTLGLDYQDGSVVASLAAAADASGSGPRRMNAAGGTASTAIDRAYELSYEEEIFFSHVNHILIGEAAASENMEELLDYLCQSPELRIDIPLYIVRDGTAKQAVMDVGDGSRGISEVMQAVHEMFSTPSDSRIFTVADTVSSLERYGSALVCAIRCEPGSESSGSQGSGETAEPESQGGVQETKQSGEAQGGDGESKQSGGQAGAEGGASGSSPLMAGIAGYGIIRDGKLCKYLEPESAVAVGLMTGVVPISFIAVKDMDGRDCSLEVYGGSAQVKPVWAGPGELRGLDIQVKVTASVMESASGKSAGAEEYINYLTGELESAVSRQLHSLLQSSMNLKADFLGLAGEVERSSPENFRLMEQSFTQVLPSLELQITVSGQLSHTNDMKEA